MKLLMIHSDFIEYEALQKTKFAEELENKKGRMEEVLVVFIAVEKNDLENIIGKSVQEIEDVAKQIKTKNITIYPYAHLSSNLGEPNKSSEILKDVEKVLLEKNYKVMRAPFGWYKSFKISCKGHPLSELSREISPEKEELTSKAIIAEEKMKSEWHILTKDGNLEDVESFDFKDFENLKKFVDYEISGSRAVQEIPAHVKLMQKMEIADYEEGSDSGNIRYYPNGRLIKSLLEDYVSKKMGDYGAVEVETPIMYDLEHPTLKKYLHKFPARQYTVLSGDKKLFLRFAACFGQFLMSKDMTISYRNLPFKMYEMARYAFRREQKGELVGLRRLRAFTMPDVHTLTTDLEEALTEFKNQFTLSMEVLKEIGIEDYEVAIRFTKDFYEKNKDFVSSLVNLINKPALIEIWDDRYFYFVLKFEFNFVDSMKKAAALSTVQIDVENSERYDITYFDENGEKQHPYLLHCSPSGAIERVMYAILENEHMRSQKGFKAMLPIWLSPTQIRVIPVSDDIIDYCLDTVNKLENIRVDLDDRDISLGKKIREAEKSWVPYIVVIGDKEKSENNLSVRVRESGENKKMSVDELKDEIKNKTKNLPFKKLSLPLKLSKRPKFR